MLLKQGLSSDMLQLYYGLPLGFKNKHVVQDHSKRERRGTFLLHLQTKESKVIIFSTESINILSICVYVVESS